MSDLLSKPCTVFAGPRRIAHGPLVDVALAVKAFEALGEAHPVLAFEDGTGAVIDLDLRGSDADVVQRLEERAEKEQALGQSDERRATEPSRSGPGRPKLGVVPREVTLLPRHWEWLAGQRGGASGAIRRLVEEAIRSDGGRSARRAAQEACYRFCTALAGNLAGYEEAMRALFAGDADGFALHTAAWPADVRAYAGMFMARAQVGAAARAD